MTRLLIFAGFLLLSFLVPAGLARAAAENAQDFSETTALTVD